jgi:signal transduction histidine kinase
MITEMLDLDRMEAGRMTLHMGRVDLNQALVDAVERGRAVYPTHTIVTDLDPALLEVSGDSDRLIQVITNLLSNAAKYSPGGGEITVRSRADIATVTVSVRDHGMGIPPEFMTKLFQRYERYESSATDRIIGTGLGLPIARQIIEMHRGRIWAESTVGEGSEFFFTLPVDARPASAA